MCPVKMQTKAREILCRKCLRTVFAKYSPLLNRVWGVKIHEISFTSISKSLFEIDNSKGCALQQKGTFAKRLERGDDSCPLPTKWHIKPTFSVRSINPIETMSIEIDKTYGAREL